MQLNLVLWLMFLLGQFTYVMKRAYFSVQGPDHTVPSYRAYFVKYGVCLGIRIVIGIGLFWLWVSYPDALSSLVARFNLNLNLNIPKVPPVALFLGLSVDFVIDWITSRVPFLAKEIPVPVVAAPEANPAQEPAAPMPKSNSSLTQ